MSLSGFGSSGMTGVGYEVNHTNGTWPTLTTTFYHGDHLGSSRMITNASGVPTWEATYLPFGQEHNPQPTVNHYKFTGKERDSESNLDYFGARHYSPALGRFTSVDPTMESAVQRMPQTWNRYSYALNSPLLIIDPDGELWIASGNANNPYTWVDKCKKGQTCYEAVAANVGGDITVYGSKNDKDITSYAANQDGMVDMLQLQSHHDSKFIVGPQNVPETHLNADTGSALFNVAHQYSNAFPGDGPLVFTAGSAANGLSGVNPQSGKSLHDTHDGGANIDLRYMGSNGRSIFGTSGSANGDLNRNQFIIAAFKAANVGLGSVLTGHPQKYGTPNISRGLRQMHRNHMHFQRNYPPSPKKGTP